MNPAITSPPAYSHLIVPRVSCQARIGWGEPERSLAQGVSVALGLRFPQPPVATASDQLEDTINYADLAVDVQRVCAAQPFRLLERLAQAIYQALRPRLPAGTALWVEVAKERSPLPALLGESARFRVGDWSMAPGASAEAPAPRAPARPLVLRAARHEDRAALEGLIARSAWGFSAACYSPEQIAGALGTAWGVDSQLIDDQTYFVVESDGELVACGGWSFRAKAFGGDGGPDRAPKPLDPGRDAARMRAFFVHPGWARRGLARVLLRHGEAQARASGYRLAELTATLCGVAFYQAHGYAAGAAIEHPLSPGLTIAFVPMRREL